MATSVVRNIFTPVEVGVQLCYVKSDCSFHVIYWMAGSVVKAVYILSEKRSRDLSSDLRIFPIMDGQIFYDFISVSIVSGMCIEHVILDGCQHWINVWHTVILVHLRFCAYRWCILNMYHIQPQWIHDNAICQMPWQFVHASLDRQSIFRSGISLSWNSLMRAVIEWTLGVHLYSTRTM